MSELESIDLPEFLGGNRLLIWGANRICQMLIAGNKISIKLLIVDIDPQKKYFIKNHEVRLPNDSVEVIQQSPLIVFCLGKVHLDDCMEWIWKKAGRRLRNSEYIILTD